MDVVLNVFGATAAPVVAIVAVDYYIFRKRKFSLDDIYKTHGKYYYWNGFNPAAMIAYVIGTAVAVIFMDYGFFISLAVTPIIYYFLAKIFGKTYPAMVSETAADIVIASSLFHTVRFSIHKIDTSAQNLPGSAGRFCA